MKKITLVLIMLLIAATSYNQSDRGTNNTNNAAQNKETNKKSNSSTNRPNNTQERKAPLNSNHSQIQNNSNNRTNQSSQPAQTSQPSHPSQPTQPSQPSHPSQPTQTSQPSQRQQPQNDYSQRNGGDEGRSLERPNRPEDPGQYDRRPAPDNNDHGRPINTQNPPVNVNRNYDRHPIEREYESPRVDRDRHTPIHPYSRPPMSREYRAQHYVYRAPVNLNIYWSPVIYHDFVRIYPMVGTWNYPMGYRIESIPAYYADDYKGQVVNVYGVINEVYYSRPTDEYFLYMGPYYPYQDFTIVMPGWLARQYSNDPEYYFNNQNLVATGLITTFEGEPEIAVKEGFQINLF